MRETCYLPDSESEVNNFYKTLNPLPGKTTPLKLQHWISTEQAFFFLRLRGIRQRRLSQTRHSSRFWSISLAGGCHCVLLAALRGVFSSSSPWAGIELLHTKPAVTRPVDWLPVCSLWMYPQFLPAFCALRGLVLSRMVMQLPNNVYCHTADCWHAGLITLLIVMLQLC